MRAKLITGALAVASLWGATAMAEDWSTTSDVGSDQKVVVKKEDKNDMRGVTMMLGAGVEGYAGSLAPRLQAGPTWGVSAVLRPTKIIGLELGYSGATNEIEEGANPGFDPGVARGPDIVRNGGHALATFGLGAAPVQPYLGAGVGIDRYTVRAGGAGFRSDTSASVPVAAGLRTHIGHFTADARLGYSWLINSDFSDFAGASGTNILGIRPENTSLYQGTLSIGSTF